MKTIEYPIKELFSFRMDKNKIWWLEGDLRQDGLFTEPTIGMLVE